MEAKAEFLKGLEYGLPVHPLDRCCQCGHKITPRNKHHFVFQQIKNITTPCMYRCDTVKIHKRYACHGMHAGVPIIETEYYVCKKGTACEKRRDKTRLTSRERRIRSMRKYLQLL